MDDGLAGEVLKTTALRPGRVVYGVATGRNTVQVRGATTAVQLSALTPVEAGDYCAVWEAPGDSLILGPVDSFEWQDITLASGNWTNSPTAQWRYIAGRIELRGAVTRTTSSFAAGGTLFNLGTGNPPEPERDYRLLCGAQVAAETPDASTIYMFVDTSTGTFRSSTSTHNLAIGDAIFLDGIWWPA